MEGGLEGLQSQIHSPSGSRGSVDAGTLSWGRGYPEAGRPGGGAETGVGWAIHTGVWGLLVTSELQRAICGKVRAWSS